MDNKNTKWVTSKTLPPILIAGSFLVGVIVSILGWALADDASWGFMVVGLAFVYTIFHYIVLGISRLFKDGDKKGSSAGSDKIKLNDIHSNDEW